MQVFDLFYPLQNIKDAKIPAKIRNGSTFNSKVMTHASPASPAPKRANMFWQKCCHPISSHFS